MVAHFCGAVCWILLKRVCLHKESNYSMISDRRVISHPPCGCLACWTRCSGVNSRNRRIGSGGRSIWPGLGWLPGPVWEALGKEAALFGSKLGPCGILTLTPTLDFWNADGLEGQADPANHNPPAASSAATPRNRCFLFIVFFLFDSRSTFTFVTGIVRGFVGTGFRFGTKAGNSGAKRQRAGMNLILSRIDCTLEIALRSTPTAASNRQKRRRLSKFLKPSARSKPNTPIGIPVFAGFRESDAWWDSSFRSSARPRSRP